MKAAGDSHVGHNQKFTPEIDAALYDEFVAVSKQNGQSQRYVLEQALAFYLHNVVPRSTSFGAK